MFADDTAAMINAEYKDQLQNKINNLLPNVTKWFQANRLTLNATKSKYQIFSRNKVKDIHITLQNTTIERRTCVRYLGMYIDENLKWHSHIAHVVLNISRNLGIMGRAKAYLSSKELLLLYSIQLINITSFKLLCCCLGHELSF